MKHLAGNYYIDADEYQFVVYEKRTVEKEGSKNIGEERYDVISNHATPEQVSEKLCRMGVAEYVNKDWKQCVDFVSESHNNFLKALQNGLSRNPK